MKSSRSLFMWTTVVTGLLLTLAWAQLPPGGPNPNLSSAEPFSIPGSPGGQNQSPGPRVQPGTAGTSALMSPGQMPSGTPQWPQEKIPITGSAGPGLESLDKAVTQIMDRHGIPGGSLAIAKDGKLVYAKGFGWADLKNDIPVQPQTTFGLASLSKPITAVSTLLLVERGKLSLDDPALYYLRHISPPRGVTIDPRLKKITIRHLLNHTGGWDRSVSGDPVTWSPQIARAYRVPMPLTNAQFISFMMGVRLNFEPGTKWQYSNVGYMFLQQIIQKVSGQPYQEFAQRNVLGPMGIKTAFINPNGRSYAKGEAHCYLAGTGVELPPLNLPMAQAPPGGQPRLLIWSGF